MKSAIYETKGRAREFNELAINLFTGCGHRCIYCYGASVTHQSQDSFKNQPRPRLTIEDIERSAIEWSVKEHRQGHTPRRVLLCFVTDPYQPIEQKNQLTRKTIEALHRHNLNVIILTKGGFRSDRDFDLLTPQDAYAVTLTCDNLKDSLYWEPNAALPLERISILEKAHGKGIETWVSLEPVIYPKQAVSIVRSTHDIVGHYKVGTMNYHPHGKSINWKEFGWGMKRLMDRLSIKYYFKRDLLKEMGVSPEKFEQTWVCR